MKIIIKNYKKLMYACILCMCLLLSNTGIGFAQDSEEEVEPFSITSDLVIGYKYPISGSTFQDTDADAFSRTLSGLIAVISGIRGGFDVNIMYNLDKNNAVGGIVGIHTIEGGTDDDKRFIIDTPLLAVYSLHGGGFGIEPYLGINVSIIAVNNLIIYIAPTVGARVLLGNFIIGMDYQRNIGLKNATWKPLLGEDVLRFTMGWRFDFIDALLYAANATE